MPLTVPCPTPVNGGLLANQLAAAGLASSVLLRGDQLEFADLDESDRAAAQAVVDAHPGTAQATLDAATTERTNADTIRDQAETALTGNRTFLNLANPTNAQIAAQVKALTKQNNGLIRLVLNRYDGTD